MAWTQDESDDFLKLFSSVEKRNQPSEADIKEAARKQRQKELLESVQAEEEKNSKSIWDRAGDIAGGVANAGKDIVVGGADFAQETFKSGKNLLDIKGEQDKEGKYQKGEAEINRKYKKEADEKVWKGFEGAASVDELSKDRQDAWNDIQARRKAEMGEYSKNNVRGDAKKTGELFKEQAKREEDFNKAGQQFYKGAQYIPGVSLGVEGAGTLGAVIDGDDSDTNKAIIKLTQGKDWDKLTDEEKKAAKTQRNIGGVLSTLDVLPAAGKVAGSAAKQGIKTTAKAGIKEGLKEGLEAGSKAFAKSAASKSIKEVTEAGAGQLLKTAVKSGGTGAAVGAGFGAGMAALQGGDVKEAAFDGARTGFVGGVIGSPLDVTGRAVKNGEFDVNATPKGLEDIDASTGKVIDDLNTDARLAQLGDEATAAEMAGRKGEFNQIQANRKLGMNDDGTPATGGQKLLGDGSGNEVRPLKQVDADIQDMQTNGAIDLTPEEAKAKWNALQEERKVAVDNDAERGFTLERDEARANFENNGLPNELPDAQKALDDFDNGTAELPTKVDTPVVGAKDIFAHDNMPEELKGAASELMQDQKTVETQLAELTDGKKAAKEQASFDEGYKARQEEIAEMPLPRQEIEQQKLDESYMKDVDELQQRFDNDAPKVDELKRIQEHLTNKEGELVRHSNYLMEQAPDQFRSVDEAEFNAQRTALADNVDTAKRFNDNSTIVNEVSQTPRPERVAQSDPDVRKAYQEKVMESAAIPIPGMKRISAIREAVLNFTSPSKNLESITGSNEIFSDIIQAESAVNIANKADINTIAAISKKITSADQAAQIIDFVQGKRTVLSSFDEETAGMIKTFFDEKAVELNKLGYKTIDDYFPQLFNKNDPNTKRLFKGKTTGDISFANLKHRIGNDGNFNKDITEVMTAYSRGYNRKVHLEPALKPLENIKLQVEASKAVGDWVDTYIENLKGITEPSGAEKAFNGIIDSMVGESKKGGNHYKQTLGTQRMISAVATMGINPGTAIRNMTQVVNTIAGIGIKDATKGAIQATRAFAAGADSPEWKEMISSGIFDGGISRHYGMELGKELGKMNTLSHVSEKGANFMMGMVRGTDVTLRAQAYWGAKGAGLDQAIKDGLTGAKAEKFAKDFAIKKVADTQFISSAADMPVKLNGAGVRSLTQLATFSLKQAEMLGSMGIKTFKRADGSRGINTKQAGNLLAAGVTAALLTEALKPVIGFNEKEWIPFYDQIASVVDPNSTAGESLYRSPLVSLIAGNGKGRTGLLDGIKSGKMDDFLEDNWSQIVPAGTQIKKSFEGLKTTTEGISRNSKGKVKYLQDMGVTNQLKASLFGQYSTDSGRQWIKDGFPTLTDGEMRLGSKEGSGDVTFEQLPRATQREFYDYYAQTKKVTGKNDATDSIKEAVRSGNIKKAERLGADYNKRATEAMKGYFAKHKELPPELQDQMTSKLFIDVQGKIDDALDEE